MLRIASVLVASTMLCCVSTVTVIPDPTVPHRLATKVEAEVWVRRADGTVAKQKVELPAGWWVAGPPVIEERR